MLTSESLGTTERDRVNDWCKLYVWIPVSEGGDRNSLLEIAHPFHGDRVTGPRQFDHLFATHHSLIQKECAVSRSGRDALERAGTDQTQDCCAPQQMGNAPSAWLGRGECACVITSQCAPREHATSISDYDFEFLLLRPVASARRVRSDRSESEVMSALCRNLTY